MKKIIFFLMVTTVISVNSFSGILGGGGGVSDYWQMKAAALTHVLVEENYKEICSPHYFLGWWEGAGSSEGCLSPKGCGAHTAHRELWDKYLESWHGSDRSLGLVMCSALRNNAAQSTASPAASSPGFGGIGSQLS